MKKLILLLISCLYTQKTQTMAPELFRAYQACGVKEILKVTLRNCQQDAKKAFQKFNYQKKISTAQIVTGIGFILTPPALSAGYIYYKVSSVIDE